MQVRAPIIVHASCASWGLVPLKLVFEEQVEFSIIIAAVFDFEVHL